jgi:hypothetical protein
MKMIALIFVPGILWAQDFDMSNQDFKTLVNKYRMAAPKNVPWAGTYWAYANNGVANNFIYDAKVSSPSPADKFDTFYKEQKAANWEKSHHSCDILKTEEEKEGCRGWWGHCNAWSGAAIKEPEPRSDKIKKLSDGTTLKLTVADQKAYLTELYMSNNALFTGNTDKEDKTGDWIFNKDDPTASKLVADGVTAYDAFWDVTPRTFFLILTNYIGIRQTGVVIDQFAGDQVWNQPLAGYKILPIRKEDIRKSETSESKEVFPVLIRMNMFWADDGVPPDVVTEKFSIENATENFKFRDFKHSEHYVGRSLGFFLYFDKPLQVSEDGKTIVSAGKIVGDGVWYHQSEEGRGKYRNFDQTHPDFIWYPTEALEDSGEERNPSFTPEKVNSILKD